MRILVISDNHHDWKIVEKILFAEKYDFSIHLGDAEVSEKTVKSSFDRYVSGNHDTFSIIEDTFDLAGIRFAILHGHTRGITVFSQNKLAVKFGKSVGAKVVIHGHTHIPNDEEIDGIRVLCPGAVSNPRSSYGCTYMVLNVSDKKIASVEFKQI